MVNKRRGETEFTTGGETYVMCMTLGAMAEIEDVFELDSISDLGDAFVDGKIKTKKLIGLLGALIRGGGTDITNEEIGNFDLDAVEAFGSAMEAINIQGGESNSPKPKPRAKRKPRK